MKNLVIKQLSVFLENKLGRLNRVSEVLGEAGINMVAFSVADNSDFGILRVVVQEPERALEVLKQHHFAVSLTDVVCLHIGNRPGTLASVLKVLEKEGVYIEYMYAFAEGEDARIVIRPDKLENCILALEKNHVDIIKSENI
jgi:hypothetical protein